ncbi:MAG: small ribosomal subunit biogenesis GTPase RsgA [Acaryochloridaceae cyanobacterium SU_2_1]|nr:small ribosomal subunit biogenesis GTPase RsgA [Acaryochloridaceae cyanobacterium SU_2_1]
MKDRQPGASSMPWTGIVLSVQANFYLVRLDRSIELQEQPLATEQLLCTRRSRLKKLGQQVMVGDRVEIAEPDWLGQRGAITQVLPRHSQIDRPPIANINQILLMFALAEPLLDPQQLTRFLVTAEQAQLQLVLCLNKRDLLGYRAQKYWRDRIQAWGYQPILISLETGVGLTLLERQLRHRLTVVSGLSGVGKSSLINHFLPERQVSVGPVSQRWGQGRHTTRHIELFELPQGGLLADTPGFHQPSLTCLPTALGNCFPEIRHRLSQGHCQFKDCLHLNEPNCAVRGEWERYPYYLNLLAEVTEQQAQAKDMATPESRTKRKTSHQGQTEYEPKLETKRYRRPSRRQLQQNLQALDLDQLEQLTSP